MNCFITQSKQIPAIGLAVALLVLGLLTACDPSEEKKAQWAEEKRVECLDKICEGDVVPKVSPTERVMKIGGRYFSVPRNYQHGFAGLVFYWPSKYPTTSLADSESFPEKGRPFSEIAIDISFRNELISVELSDMIATAVSEGRSITHKSQSRDLEVVTVQVRSHPIEQSTIYIAKNTSFPSGKPAALGCGLSYRCGAYFSWQKNLSVEVQFDHRHAQDWPQIYAEITRVLSLVKPL